MLNHQGNTENIFLICLKFKWPFTNASDTHPPVSEPYSPPVSDIVTCTGSPLAKMDFLLIDKVNETNDRFGQCITAKTR